MLVCNTIPLSATVASAERVSAGLPNVECPVVVQTFHANVGLEHANEIMSESKCKGRPASFEQEHWKQCETVKEHSELELKREEKGMKKEE